jgi:hypothetical protein
MLTLMEMRNSPFSAVDAQELFLCRPVFFMTDRRTPVMAISKLTDIVLSRFVRTLLIAGIVHFAQVIRGCAAAVDDGSTHIGFPWVFARWSGGTCFGICSSFNYYPLLETIYFWLAAAFFWSYLGWLQYRRNV